MSNRVRAPWILTHSGAEVDLLEPEAEQISAHDIAHHLSLLCRFAGATRNFYSVAQHSCLVLDIVTKQSDCTPLTMQWAILHDAHEAFIGDISTPMRRAIADFTQCGDVIREMSLRFDAAVLQRFGLPNVLPQATLDAVRHADLVALETERHRLLPENRSWLPTVERVPWHGQCWCPERAEFEFAMRLYRVGLADHPAHGPMLTEEVA